MMAKHGGARVGAGRPRGVHSEPTKVMRVPLSKIGDVKMLVKSGGSHKIPLYSTAVQAGFPSPADDYIEDNIDLNRYLITNAAATFLVRASGDSMINASIQSGDILVVDRSIVPVHGKIVIAAIDGELTVKRLYVKEGVTKLLPENPAYQAITITESQDALIWGVVTNVIHSC